MSKLERIALLRKVTKHLVNFYNYAWLFLEIHMQKIVFVSFALLCINDVSEITYNPPHSRLKKFKITINRVIKYAHPSGVRDKFLLHRRRSHNDQFQEEHPDKID